MHISSPHRASFNQPLAYSDGRHSESQYPFSLIMAFATSNSALQKEAIDRARAAFAKLPHDNTLFQQCIGEGETVHSVLESLCQKCSAYKRKTSTKLLERFYRCSAWMTNISDSVDIAVQTSAGIACPLWAPIKFVLKVRPYGVTRSH